MRVNLLCSGSKGNCCIIEGSSTSIMIDCGPGTKKYLTQACSKIEFSLSDLDAVLVTHNHSDHIRQLRTVADHPIYSYCPIQITDTKKRPIPFEHHQIVPDEIFEIGEFSIYALGLSHDAGETLGFVIEDAHTRLVYVTDTGFFPMDYTSIIQGADYYIMESNHDVDMLMHTNRSWWLKQRILSDTGHMNNQDASNLLASVVTPNTKKIVLAHLSEEANEPELALQALQEALAKKGYALQDFEAEAASQFEVLSFGRVIRDEGQKANPVLLPKTDQKTEDRSC